MRNAVRRVAAVMTSGLVAAVMASAATPVASAHNALIDSTPEDGSTISDAPPSIELVFDQEVQNQFPQVAIIDADETHYEQGEPEVVGSTVTQAVGELPGGEYVVSYRVVSADGHPVEGSITFVVGSPGDQSEVTEPGADDDSGIGAVWLIGLAAVVLAALTLVVLAAGGGRRRSARETEQS